MKYLIKGGGAGKAEDTREEDPVCSADMNGFVGGELWTTEYRYQTRYLLIYRLAAWEVRGVTSMSVIGRRD